MNEFLKSILYLIVLTSFCGCYIFENEDYINQSHVDYLVGVKESGRLKKELHFSSSKDETANSVIESFYKNNQLLKKLYTDNNLNEPFVLQKDTFIYENEKLSQMLHFFRTGATTSPLVISDIYYYYYPDENTHIEVKYEKNGELDDSTVYIYSGNFLVEERHYSNNRFWGDRYEYNSDGKVLKMIVLPDENPLINYFDENGVLEKAIYYEGEEERTIMTYERENKRNQLIIYCYIKHLHLSETEPFLSSHRKFENGKLIESVKYHPTFPGSEWWCTRYEYF